MSSDTKDEILKENQKKGAWGGSRPGAGRKLHSKNPSTIEREEASRQFKDRVAKNVDRLFNAQLDLAIGEKYLMVITTIGSGAKQRRETSIVTDPDLIKKFLDEELEDTDTEYYFMSTKPANNMAIDSLLNRSLGKAPDKIEMEHSGEINNSGQNIPELSRDFAEYLKERTKS